MTNVIITPKVDISHVDIFISLCTDSMIAVGAFISEFSNTISPSTPGDSTQARRKGSVLRRDTDPQMTSSLDENAFARPPEFTADADMIRDNLPLNTEYLEDSFGAAAGFRDLTEDDLEDFNDPDDPEAAYAQDANAPRGVAHETIRILDPLGVRPVEYYFDNMTPEDLTPR
jgi:autophagy-related protein 2